jgi:hypothetical protein
MIFSSIHIIPNDKILSFVGWIATHYIYFLYALSNWWTLIFPFLDYCEKCWNQHEHNVSWAYRYHMPKVHIDLGIYPPVELLDHMLVLFLLSGGMLHIAYHNGCANLHSQKECKGFPFSTFLRACVIFRFL